jgi:hypothetical protein
MPSSSLILSVGTALCALSSTAFATQYQKEDTFNGKNWLDAFKFETNEFNSGFVNYVDEPTAKSLGLYSVDGSDVKFGVDFSETLNYKEGPGRKSVRLEGKKNYNKGLFIIDVKRMPGVCGMWPAFWSLGQEPWPVKGEIDIIEGVNDNKVNKYVLHTDTKCKVNGQGQSQSQAGKDCAYDTAGSSGCDVNERRTNSFGKGFNDNHGGHYVMEWDSDAIRTWFFPRGSNLPSGFNSDSPDTSKFGPPAANFQGDCNIDERFKDQRFIFTNNFCGEWAGNAYAESGCPMQKDDDTGAPLSPMESCKKYVAQNPQAFVGQYWQIGSFRTFSKKSVSSSASVSMSRTSSVASRSASSSAISSSVRASSTPVGSSSVRISSTPISASSHAVSSSVVSSSAAHISGSASVNVLAVSASVSASDLHLSSSIGLASASVSASASVNTPAAVLSSDLHIPTPITPLNVSVSNSSADLHAHVPTPIVHLNGTASNSSQIHTPEPIVHLNGTASNSSSEIHTPIPIVHLNGTASNSSSEIHTPVPIVPGNGSSVLFPTGQSSAVIHPSGSGAVHAADSSPTASIHHFGNFSAPVSYSVPAYTGSASAVVYGGNAAQSTPCTTSTAHGNYGGNPSYPASSPVKNDYPYLPSFTPLSPVYPPTTSMPAYNDYNQPPVSKTTITTTYTTTYVDVCETGYTTKTTTFAVTYCPTNTPAVPTPGKPNNPPTYGWDITTKVCNSGCGNGPKTVTVTVPCTKCDYAAKSTPTPAVPNKPSCNGYDCPKDVTTTKVYQTKIITLTKVPVPEGPKSVYDDKPKSSAPVYGDKPSSVPADAPKSTPAVSKPVVPATSPVVSKPAVPTPGKPGNGTVSMSFGTGVVATPSKTGYGPAVFTGAAANVQVGGAVAMVGAVAAMFL